MGKRQGAKPQAREVFRSERRVVLEALEMEEAATGEA